MTRENENKKENTSKKIEVLIMSGRRISFLLTITENHCVLFVILLSNYKASNLRRHYKTNHPQFSNQYPPNSKLRSDKLASLKSNLNKQQSILITFSNEANNVTEASFFIVWNIARAKFPYGEGEFIKKT
jgi:hypothetical protein